jgi:ankyrin repeat protein
MNYNRASSGVIAAVKRGDISETSRILKSKPSAIADHDSAGWTALHISASRGRADLVSKLLENGAATIIESKTECGCTALFWAAYKGSLEVVSMLVENGASVHSSNNVGNTPLHAASMWGHIPVMRALLAAGASISAQNNSGRVPLDCSLYVKQFSSVDISLRDNIARVLAEVSRMESPNQCWIGIVGKALILQIFICYVFDH